MKNYILTLLLLTITSTAFSQDYLDEIASKACECTSNLSSTLDEEQFNIELGLCLFEAASPYRKQLKKDHKIDFDKIDKKGKKLGRLIGIKMVGICPNIFKDLYERTEGTTEPIETTEKVEKELSVSVFEGQVTAVSDNKFVEFSVKDNQGKVSKFIWLTFIDSNADLSNDYKSLADKSIRLTFQSQEFFDVRIGEYRVFKIIKSLEIIEQ